MNGVKRYDDNRKKQLNKGGKEFMKKWPENANVKNNVEAGRAVSPL
jgi:hypothetical protein